MTKPPTFDVPIRLHDGCVVHGADSNPGSPQVGRTKSDGPLEMAGRLLVSPDGRAVKARCCRAAPSVRLFLQLVDLVVGNRPGQRHVLPAMTRLATYTLTIALLAVLVLVLAGCGGGSGGGY